MVGHVVVVVVPHVPVVEVVLEYEEATGEMITIKLVTQPCMLLVKGLDL